MAKKTKTIDMSDRDYRRVKVVGEDGRSRHSAHNDDAVARALLTFITAGGDLDKVLKDNKLGDIYPKGRRGFGNAGLFRMTLGGSLRALVRSGTPAKIGDIVVKTLEQRVADPSIGDGAKPKKKAKAKPKKKAKAKSKKAKRVRRTATEAQAEAA